MTKIAKLVCSTILILFIITGISHASDESIPNFDSNITIQEDGSILVSEKITYDFKDNIRHGIIRKIPLSSQNGPNIKIEVLDIYDENHQNYNYTKQIESNILSFKIGDPDLVISGLHTYIINYKVTNVIRGFDDHDELYWNITGNEWSIPIDNAQAIIDIPQSIPMEQIKVNCFVTNRIKEQNCNYELLNHQITVTSNNIKPLDGLTVSVWLPKNYIQNLAQKSEASSTNKVTDYINSAIILIFLVVIIITIILSLIGIIIDIKYSFRLRYYHIFSPEPVITRYEPPPDLNPLDVGCLYDQCFDPVDLSALLIDLAIRGFIKIHYIEQKTNFVFAPFAKPDFEFEKLKNGSELTHPLEKKLFSIIFQHGSRVSLKQLKNKITFTEFNSLFDQETNHLKQKGLIVLNKFKFIVFKLNPIFRSVFIYAGVLICFSLIRIFNINSSLYRTILFLMGLTVFALLINKFIRILTNAPGSSGAKKFRYYDYTSQGLKTFRDILGYYEFIDTAKQEQLEVLYAPEEKPEKLIKILPYAMVFRVETKWAKLTEKLIEIPTWYDVPPETGTFNSTLFVHHLSMFNNQVGSTFNFVPSGSGSFGSGFSGGGFSGGGSGGGGGSSW